MSLAETRVGDGSLAMGLKHITFVFPLALLFYIYNYQLSSTGGPIIRISNGLLEGISGESRDGREFYEYLGIPYARPPVDELRFEPPKPALDWIGKRLANQYGPQCTQIEFFTKKLKGKEDCLYLNVFVPNRNYKTDGSEHVLPVMVFFHGGYFMSGGANSYRPEYFMDQDIILVTINYRTAALGFLNTGDEIVRGNMGLKDQVAALKWVQTNIIKFGGDPKQVTIFGASAGGASVHYHIISPMSKGLFHKAISQSGTAIKIWSFVSQPIEQSKRLGIKLNCPINNSTVLVSCLKKLDANLITSTHWEYLSVFLHPLAIYAPSIEYIQDENTFLSEHPYNILLKGNENKIPWMCGLNSDEGLLFTSRIIENKNSIQKINEEWNESAPLLLGYSEIENIEQRDEITNKITKFYFENNNNNNNNLNNINFIKYFQNFTNMLSDHLYFTATHESTLLQRKYSPIYNYYYTYKSQFSFGSVLKLTGKYPPILELAFDFIINWIQRNIFKKQITNLGVCHGDELVMLFDLGFLSKIHEGHQDYNMSKAVVKLWSDFAYSKFNTSLDFQNIKWLPQGHTTSPLKLLNLDTIPSIIDEPYIERVNFWNSIGIL